jgi:subtilase family serine protease
LRVSDQAALTAFLAGLSEPGSPLFHQFLRPGQFGPRFGPTLAQVAAVEGALRSAGLSPGPVSANRLAIPVTATAAAVDRALGAGLVRYRLPGGRVAYANSAAPRLPASVAPLVSGVVGLSSLYPQQSLVSWPAGPARRKTGPASGQDRGLRTPDTAAGPRPCANAQGVSAEGAFTANQLAAHYGMSPLYRLGDLGQSTRIALIEFEPNLTSDITAYQACYGIKATVNYVQVSGGAGTGAGSGEAALDIEDAAGLAPGAVIDVYQAPNTAAGNYDDYQQLISRDTDQVLSTSWGLCENYLDRADGAAQETLFEQAAAQGQPVLAAGPGTR